MVLLESFKRWRFTENWLILMIDGGENKTVLLIEHAFINGEMGSIISGKFLYVGSRVSSLFSLQLETVGIAEDVFSNYGAFILLRLFWLVSVGWKNFQGFGGWRLGTGDLHWAISNSAFRNSSRIEQIICHIKENRHFRKN